MPKSIFLKSTTALLTIAAISYHHTLFAQDTAAELEVALAEAVAKVKRQLIKSKDKMQAHH